MPATDSPKKGFSLSLGLSKTSLEVQKKGTSVLSSVGKRLHDDSDRSDDEDSHRGKIQHVSGFNNRGAVHVDPVQERNNAPLIIPSRTNADWRAEAKRRKELWLPAEARNGAQNLQLLDKPETQENKPKFGLQLAQTRTAPLNTNRNDEKDADAVPGAPKTEDEVAIAALLKGDESQKSSLVVPMAETNGNWRTARQRPAELSFDEAYRQDIGNRPDSCTLVEYDNIPVEEFGAALLRGMGWKEGQAVGRNRGKEQKPALTEKRQAFLGIGAKPQAAVEDLGVWGKTAKALKKKGNRIDKTYSPVVLRDKRTGHIIDTNDSEASSRASLKGLQGREGGVPRDDDNSGRVEKDRYRDRRSDHDTDRVRNDRRRDDDNRDEYTGYERRKDRSGDDDRARRRNRDHNSPRDRYVDRDDRNRSRQDEKRRRDR